MYKEEGVSRGVQEEGVYSRKEENAESYRMQLKKSLT